MPITLIEQLPNFTKKVDSEKKLQIAELFCDTIQGEGVNTGIISTFMRLQGCTLKCVWCDTLEVWPYGNEYSFDEIFELFESVGLIKKLFLGQHLILTGGSPLKQQKQLIKFIDEFIDKYSFKPYIEIENEGVLKPDLELVRYIDCWNNSPKLANSGMKKNIRIKEKIIEQLNSFDNSWFKFVISANTAESDWKEIEEDYLSIIENHNKNKIILMPEGDTQEKLNKSREIVADLAIKKGVRFSDRLHVTIWNKRTGI